MTKKRYVVEIVTDAAGAGVGYTPSTTGNVLAVQYIKPASGGYTDPVTLTVSGETTGEVILQESSVAASMTRRPRLPMHSSAGAEEVVGETYMAVDERIKITVAAGAAVGTGTFVVTVG